MKYAVHSSHDILQIDMEGVLTFIDALAFNRLISMMKAANAMSEIHLNIHLLQYVDSSGLAMLMEAHDMAKKKHLSLVFQDPQGQVRDMLYKAAACNALCIAA